MKINCTICVSLLIVVISAFSCAKSEKGVTPSCENKLTKQEALQEFAVILSKAIADNEEMRAFFKEEALKEFDRDNDVFYPYVKSHVFSSGKTLQQVLAAHEDYEHQLNDIETAVPKLTILVPDFAWVDANCFSVKNWDTSCENLCVGYDDREDEHSLFFKGELMGKLPANYIPSFPVLIVKSNERMCVTTTKSGEIEYSFANPVFNGELATKGYYECDVENEAEPDNDLFSKTENFISCDELTTLSPFSIQAYDEFSTGMTAGVQRDYVYYGMTKEKSSNGELDIFKKDLLYRFRLTPDAIVNISEEDEPKDPQVLLWTRRDDFPEFEQVTPRIWGDGKYEIYFKFYQAYPSSGATCVGELVFHVAPEDAMYVERYHRKTTWNWFGNNWSSYEILASNIKSKWIYPGDERNADYTSLSIISTSWDLSKLSDNIYMDVYEYDESATISKTQEGNFKQSFSVGKSSNAEVGIDKIIKFGLGVTGSFGGENTWKESYTYTYTKGSDDLGSSQINYIDNYILATETRNGKAGYVLKAVGNKNYAVSFLPIDSRDEYTILQALRNRKQLNR